MNGRRLLQEVVQKERRLRRELHDTVERKEFISYRMVKHQVSPSEALETIFHKLQTLPQLFTTIIRSPTSPLWRLCATTQLLYLRTSRTQACLRELQATRQVCHPERQYVDCNLPHSR